MLFRASEIAGDAQPRLHELVGEFGRRIGDAGFPCTFAAPAWRRDELLFAWICGRQDEVLAQLLNTARQATEAIRAQPEQVVVVFVEPVPGCLEDERLFASAVLRYLRSQDSVAWPADAPTDPSDAGWVFWFDGVDLFINISTPGHTLRRSRNLGPAFTLVLQSRSSFDTVSTPRVRELIRARLATYDQLPPHPELGSYGDPNNREARQYFLGDSNDVSVDLVDERDMATRQNPS
jgi:hypothetical protein